MTVLLWFHFGVIFIWAGACDAAMGVHALIQYVRPNHEEMVWYVDSVGWREASRVRDDFFSWLDR